jgi:hypothetical protein
MATSSVVSYTENLMKYMKLDQMGSGMAEYIWIDATGGVRSKSKVSDSQIFPLPNKTQHSLYDKRMATTILHQNPTR